MTTFKLGYTNPLTDAFGAHPVLGGPLDLNDGVTYTVLSPDGVSLGAPPRSVVSAGNIRSQGERGVRAIYRQPREVGVSVILGPGASYSSFVANVRALLAWVNAAPSMPLTIQYQPFSASQPVYLDVIAAAHNIPDDEDMWLRLQLEPVELVFLARPGLRGDRVTLSNLVMNPGMESPMGGPLAPAVTVFVDTFANVDAYTVLSGGAPTVAASVMTVQNNSVITFGSPAWGAIQTWQVRFKYVAGQTINFLLHRTDGNNKLYAEVFTNTWSLNHNVAGVNHALASASPALTSGNFYWAVMTQFPSAPGSPPFLWASLYNDSGGSVGAAVAGGFISAACFDALTALSGVMGFETAGGAATIGGAFSSVHAVVLFGPGGWAFSNFGTAVASGAWEGSWAQAPTSTNANCYPNGPVSSYGCLRVDLPPTGAVNAQWNAGNAGSAALIQQTGQPVAAPGNVLGVSAWVKSSGVANSCTQELLINEYDSTGAFLRQNVVAGASVTGAQAAWTQLSGSYTTGASCAYVLLILAVVDATSASANGIVWCDNAQVYNQTATGLSSMPYCELRFPNAPAQLVVSGLLGDLPAPASLSFGSYLASFAPGGALSFAVGRAGQTNKAAQLVGPAHGWYTSALSPQSTPALDSTAYNGYYDSATVTSAGWSPRAFSTTPAAAPGVYHLYGRFKTAQALGNLPNVQTRAIANQRSQQWYGALDGSDALGAYYGPYSSPVTASNQWTVADSGQVSVPLFNQGAQTDGSQTYLTPRQQWIDSTGGGSSCGENWEALVPVDGSLLVGVLNNPSNSGVTFTARWLMAYFDGLLVNRASALDGPGWLLSTETAAMPNPAHAGGGPGTQSTGTLNVNSGADPYLTVDPTLAGSTNVLVAVITDTTGDVLPFVGELVYSPLYLQPR